MAIRKYKPNVAGTSISRRFRRFDEITATKAYKPLTAWPQEEIGWPQQSGRVTMWQRGGGHKRTLSPVIDFKRDKRDGMCR